MSLDIRIHVSERNGNVSKGSDTPRHTSHTAPIPLNDNHDGNRHQSTKNVDPDRRNGALDGAGVANGIKILPPISSINRNNHTNGTRR